jgi:hypothetical protein
MVMATPPIKRALLFEVDEFLAFLRVLQSRPVNLLLSTYWTMGAVRHGDYIAKVRFDRL